MFCCWFPFWTALLMACWTDRPPHPRIVPRSISGHGMFLWGHVSLARLHICLTGRHRQWISMWSIDSVVPHVAQNCLSATACIWDQKSPILKTSCIALKRYCRIFGRIAAFLVLIHIVYALSYWAACGAWTRVTLSDMDEAFCAHNAPQLVQHF